MGAFGATGVAAVQAAVVSMGVAAVLDLVAAEAVAVVIVKYSWLVLGWLLLKLL